MPDKFERLSDVFIKDMRIYPLSFPFPTFVAMATDFSKYAVLFVYLLYIGTIDNELSCILYTLTVV